ncbi:40S ribosomal protein S29 [Striga asiatica]|uniref:40S ribosomal protein S29 n=1 Tax=Striga asiatica TaxID=4170 RepID=A0A5A7R5P1_STRAF|nr:40S ribosomal protein S29 [Striga asiatica]
MGSSLNHKVLSLLNSTHVLLSIPLPPQLKPPILLIKLMPPRLASPQHLHLSLLKSSSLLLGDKRNTAADESYDTESCWCPARIRTLPLYVDPSSRINFSHNFVVQKKNVKKLKPESGSWRNSRVFGNPHAIIKKYGLICCRKCYNAKDIGFIKEFRMIFQRVIRNFINKRRKKEYLRNINGQIKLAGINVLRRRLLFRQLDVPRQVADLLRHPSEDLEKIGKRLRKKKKSNSNTSFFFRSL